jgi:hypothetical protein
MNNIIKRQNRFLNNEALLRAGNSSFYNRANSTLDNHIFESILSKNSRAKAIQSSVNDNPFVTLQNVEK